MIGRLAISAVAVLLSVNAAWAAPPPPSGAHPRIFLTPPVLAALKAKVGTSGSASAGVVELCRKVASDAASFNGSGYQGDKWSFAASACALAYQLTGDASFAASGITLWRSLLEDVSTRGDKKACVAGATADLAIASVRRDTGYAIRFIGPHAALVYDWLHDAPGVDEALRSQSRACFRAWSDWYTTKGYLRTQPGANYHAGYVLAKTLIAVAMAGEDGADGDRIWTETVDDIFAKQLVANGLAADNGGVPRAGGRHGALVGGDWPEGWQYGSLSVLEYALAARAVEEQGVMLPEMHAWANDLAARYSYGINPKGDGAYIGGDSDAEDFDTPPPHRLSLAPIIGPGSDEAAGWAYSIRARINAKRDEAPIFDALAEARVVAPLEFRTPARPLWYLARGTRNVYARSGWNAEAFWAVFTSAPRLVDDHQHLNASSFILSRGPDPLVVDPSPYGTRSSLTGNAVTVDSDVVLGDYKPSQTPWGQPDLRSARGSASGVVAASADFSAAFMWKELPSDVPLGRREWAFLPEGEVVVIDRVRTDSAQRAAYLRFRTPAPLTLSAQGPLSASGISGGSKLVIHAVALSPKVAPVIAAIPKTNECTDPAFGACTAARIAVTEYSLKMFGPEVLAVHVLDALGKDESAADVASINAPPIDIVPAQNAAVVGASVWRASKATFVLAAADPAGASAATLTYGVPGANSARHVVFDAPEDGQFRTAVSAAADGTRCVITLAKEASATGATLMLGRPAIFAVAPVAEGCKVIEETDVRPGTASPGVSGVDFPTVKTSGGCACSMRHIRHKKKMLAFALLTGAFASVVVISRRRRRSDKSDR